VANAGVTIIPPKANAATANIARLVIFVVIANTAHVSI
jgi:hypothetical protein